MIKNDILTAILTLIGGIILYVIGRLIEQFILEPLKDYKGTIADISYTLMFYANIYSNINVASPEEKNETSSALRKLASELSTKTYQVNWYKLFSTIKTIPTFHNSMAAVATLIGFSNSLSHADFKDIDEKQQKIKKLLNISF